MKPNTHPVGATKLEQLPEYFFALANKKIKDLEQAGGQVLNFGIGGPDLPPHESVIARLNEEASKTDTHIYPGYVGIPELREAISSWYQRHHQVTLDVGTQVLPLGGSKQGLVYLTMAVTNPGDKVLIPELGYATFSRGCLMTGAEPLEYQLTADYTPDINALAKMDVKGVKLMWINYPHNPTGATISVDQMRAVLDFARAHHIIVASDNPYSHVTFDGYRAPSILEVAGPDDLVVEFNSMSKTYNMAGWRIGWVVGHPEVIKAVSIIYGNIETGIFIPAQRAAATALNLPDSWIVERNRVYEQRRELAGKLLTKLGCSFEPTKASLYAWAKLPSPKSGQKTKVDSAAFSTKLLEEKLIFVAPGVVFGRAGEGFIRISLTQPEAVFEAAIKRL